jgi:hypothetical protein
MVTEKSEHELAHRPFDTIATSFGSKSACAGAAGAANGWHSCPSRGPNASLCPLMSFGVGCAR